MRTYFRLAFFFVSVECLQIKMSIHHADEIYRKYFLSAIVTLHNIRAMCNQQRYAAVRCSREERKEWKWVRLNISIHFNTFSIIQKRMELLLSVRHFTNHGKGECDCNYYSRYWHNITISILHSLCVFSVKNQHFPIK